MSSKYIILDGGMGRELSARNAPFRQPEWSALALWQAPEIIEEIHLDFLKSGADIITTNSYAVVPFHIGIHRFTSEGKSLAELSGKIAHNAVSKFLDLTGKQAKVAGSLPPLFGSYRPDLFDIERATDIATPLLDGLSDFADLWLLETQSSLIEVETILNLIKQRKDCRPIWIAFTLEDENISSEPKLRSGESLSNVIEQLINNFDISSILFNCCQPEVIKEAIIVSKQIIDGSNSDILLGAYANAFTPEGNQGEANEQVSDIRSDLTYEEYLSMAKTWSNSGARIIGGCCGIGPQYIQYLSNYFKESI